MKKLSAQQVIAFLEKEAFGIEKIQMPEKEQVVRPKTAVIIKGNPEHIDGNPHAHKFYTNLAAQLRDRGYAVTFDPGNEHTMPQKADLWIGHSRGASRCRYAPEGQKSIMLGAPGGINHPMDRAMQAGQIPDVFHYQITNEMLSAIDKHKK